MVLRSSKRIFKDVDQRKNSHMQFLMLFPAMNLQLVDVAMDQKLLPSGKLT